MSLEPVILREVQIKASEIKTDGVRQTQAVIADNATKRDEINAKTAVEIKKATDAIASQTTALVADNVIKRNEVNSNTNTARDNIKSHTTAEMKKTTDAIASQTTAIVADNATKRNEVNTNTNNARDNIKSHVTTEVKKTTDAITSQTTAIVADNATKRNEVNTNTNDARNNINVNTNNARNNIRSHVTAEIKKTNDVLEVKAEEIKSHITKSAYVSKILVSSREMRVNLRHPNLTMSITPPVGHFVRLVKTVSINTNATYAIDLGYGEITIQNRTNLRLAGTVNYFPTLSADTFRVGGGLSGPSPSVYDGSNPLKYLDGGVGMPVKIRKTADFQGDLDVGYEIWRIL